MSFKSLTEIEIEVKIVRYEPGADDLVGGHPDNAQEGWPAEIEIEAWHNGHDISDILSEEAMESLELEVLNYMEREYD